MDWLFHCHVSPVRLADEDCCYDADDGKTNHVLVDYVEEGKRVLTIQYANGASHTSEFLEETTNLT
eukprot:5142410-Amphidinium_carterae.2